MPAGTLSGVFVSKGVEKARQIQRDSDSIGGDPWVTVLKSA
jgi:hypothetical protein